MLKTLKQSQEMPQRRELRQKQQNQTQNLLKRKQRQIQSLLKQGKLVKRVKNNQKLSHQLKMLKVSNQLLINGK